MGAPVQCPRRPRACLRCTERHPRDRHQAVTTATNTPLPGRARTTAAKDTATILASSSAQHRAASKSHHPNSCSSSSNDGHTLAVRRFSSRVRRGSTLDEDHRRRLKATTITTSSVPLHNVFIRMEDPRPLPTQTHIGLSLWPTTRDRKCTSSLRHSRTRSSKVNINSRQLTPCEMLSMLNSLLGQQLMAGLSRTGIWKIGR
jgi:hypothetical protein